MLRRDSNTYRRRSTAFTAMVAGVALLAAACSGDDDNATTTNAPTTTTGAAVATTAPADPVGAAQDRVSTAQDGVTTAQDALTSAHSDFCGTTTTYVEALDRYGHAFTDNAATVGDVKTLGADLVAPKDAVVTAAGAVDTAKTGLATAQQELVDAQAALAAAIATASSVPNSTATPTTSTTTTLVPPATIQRVQQAEDDLARVSAGITDATALVKAGADYNSAALALEMSWLRLLDDAQCFTDKQQANAAEQIAAYTTALQTDLTTAGYDPGPVDGVYGPKTVAAVNQLQKDSKLPVTGFVDEATGRALQDKLTAAGQTQAQQVVMLQTILKAAGFWDAAIDGVWTPELTQALKDFQTHLGVPATGVVDAATIAAFQQALAALQSGTPATTAPPGTAAPAPTTTSAAAPPTTAAATAATVSVTDSTLGKILTAADGKTLYLFLHDTQGGAPTCTGGCAGAWPPYTVTDPSTVTGGTGVDAALLGTVAHPDGHTQVTYNGWPLYFYSGDVAPGETNGQGQTSVWYVVDATGNAIK